MHVDVIRQPSPSSFAWFWIYLGQQSRDLTLLHGSMNVQDGLVDSTEQGLVFQQVQQVHSKLY